MNTTAAQDHNPKTLTIKWQRLVENGKTCPRCAGTEQELERAVQTLHRSLAILGINIEFVKSELPMAEFKQSPLESNRIWINGLPFEHYLGGKVSQSPCCDVCGPNDCRTIEINDQTYETIPAELIIRAGLLAAGRLLQAQSGCACCGEK